MLGTSACGNFISGDGIFFTVGWIVCMWFTNAFFRYCILCFQCESSRSIFVWSTWNQCNIHACAELDLYKAKWACLLQVASSHTPWSCASRHHVRFQIPCAAVETQTSRNTKKWKMKPCSRCSYEERNIFHFLFLWWIRSSFNHATPCPLSRVLLLSHLSPKFRLCWRDIILRSQEFLFLDLVIAKPVASTRISRPLKINDICWDRRQTVLKWVLFMVMSSLDGCMNYLQ